MKEQLLEQVIAVLERECNCSYDECCENVLYELVPGECNVDVDNKHIIEWCRAEDPLEAFKSGVEELYASVADSARNVIMNTVREKWDSEEFPWIEYGDEILKWLAENLQMEYPFPDLLHQMVSVDIIVNTGDAAHGFKANNLYPYYNRKKKEYGGASAPKESSALWLAKQQGYSKYRLENALVRCDFSGSRLLRGIREELLQSPCEANALCFFVEMTLGRLLTMQSSIRAARGDIERGIVLDKLTLCGFYDPQTGKGSLLDNIDLEKEVYLPYKYIYSALPNGGRETIATNVFGTAVLFSNDSILAMS